MIDELDVRETRDSGRAKGDPWYGREYLYEFREVERCFFWLYS